MSDSDDSDYWNTGYGTNIVIDNGSYMIRSGFAGDDTPKAVTPNMIGQASTDHKEQDSTSMVSLKYPMNHGIITSPDDMEIIWYNIFENELEIEPSERKILLTDHALNSKSNKEKMTEIIFETFNFESMYIGK